MFGLPYKLILAVLLVVVAYLYTSLVVFDADESDQELQNVIDAWQSTITKPQKQFSHVAIGVNACVDLIVEGTEMLEALGIEPGHKHEHATLTSLEDLQEAFHHQFALGAAAERFFSNGQVFDAVIEKGAKLEGANWYIGGNAALMAQKMADTFPGLQINLSGPVGPRLRNLLHKDIRVPTGSVTESDEVHLIMQFSVGDQWADSVTPIATRFITSHDMANSQVMSLEAFFDNIRSTSPDLVVLAGLHMLESQPQDMWEQRIQATANGIWGIPRATPIHMELASMANRGLMRDIITKVLPAVDSLGLNEQELSFISQVMECPHGDIFEGQGQDQPSIERVTSVLAWILNTERHRKSSRLTRIHFHCLSFHVLVVSSGTWQNTEASVAAGSRIASFQACATDFLDETSTEIRVPSRFKLSVDSDEIEFNSSKPVSKYMYDGLDFIFSPVLVCKQPLKTVGLGDAISAMGLMYSSYSEKQ